MGYIGARIRALRTAKQITLPALAAKAGLSKGLLSNIETDEASNPSLSTLYKIAEGLEMTVADILESERVVIKRPAEEPAELKKLAAHFRAQGKEPDPDILDALAVLRNRKGNRDGNLDHWKFLYTSIENSFKQ